MVFSLFCYAYTQSLVSDTHHSLDYPHSVSCGSEDSPIFEIEDET